MKIILAAMLVLSAPAWAQQYAKVEGGVVTNVIVASPEFIATQEGLWLETWPNGGARKNSAAKGYAYDLSRDAFIPPRPYPSWTLNETTAQWVPPSRMPVNKKWYRWDEGTKAWVVKPLGSAQ